MNNFQYLKIMNIPRIIRHFGCFKQYMSIIRTLKMD